ncbi:MAG: hypothetical protein WAR79_10745 [Melioribacteraceae bacterium]
MIKFLLICLLVFVVVDLFVRFIIDPLIRSSNKKVKSVDSKALKFKPTFRLATETMYDGGKPYNKQKNEPSEENENISNNNTTE